jgi:predicted ATPase
VPPDKTLNAAGFGHRNVFIGQNNAGKSLPLRFLLLFIRGAKQAGPVLWARQNLGDVYAESLWQKDKARQATVDLVFTTPYDDLETEMRKKAPDVLLLNQGVWQFRSVLRFPENQHNALLEFTPLVEHASVLVPLCKYNHVNQQEFLDNNGQYVQQESYVAQKVKERLATPFQQWLQGCRFFDPLRGLTRPSNRPKDDLIEDGSSLTGEMNTLQHNLATTDEFDRWQAKVCDKLSKLFSPAYSNIMVRGQTPEMLLVQNVSGALPLPLRHLGTGVQQLIIAYARLVKDAQQHRTYFFEEPESNLHPKLLRGFIRDLADYETIQFFITTHSSALLERAEALFW